MSRRYDGTGDGRPIRPEGGSGAEPADLGRAERGEMVRRRYGGFDWIATFLGFAVAIFFLTVLLGIVAAVIGSVGYQMGTAVPKAGESVSGATQQLGAGALAGSILALFLAYLIGGYTAGRLARFGGVKNGLGVVVWTILMTIILGVLGAVLGSRFNVASQLHLNIDTSSLTLAGLISLAVTLAVMLVAAGIGGALGARYHARIDRSVQL